MKIHTLSDIASTKTRNDLAEFMHNVRKKKHAMTLSGRKVAEMEKLASWQWLARAPSNND